MSLESERLREEAPDIITKLAVLLEVDTIVTALLHAVDEVN